MFGPLTRYILCQLINNQGIILRTNLVVDSTVGSVSELNETRVGLLIQCGVDLYLNPLFGRR